MDIRTKLALALVSVSLISMALLGAFAYQTGASLLKQLSLRQLDALAETKRDDLEKVIVSWQDRVRLIRSRTQLRLLLAEYARRPDPELLTVVTRIVSDAQQAVGDIRRVSLADAEGNELVTRGGAQIPGGRIPVVAPDVVAYSGIALESDGSVDIVFHTRLELEGQHVGNLEVVFDAAELETVTNDYSGLGETGETYAIVEIEPGVLFSLSPLRHDPTGKWRRVRRDAATPAALAALRGSDTVFPNGLLDYRNQPVWGAVRFLPQLGWGLVVKVDIAEESRLAAQLRDRMVDIGLSLSAFAILGGTLLGFYLARPIRRLADVMDRIRRGESHLRADEGAEDEVASLSRSLNELLDDLDRRNGRESAG